MSVIAQAELQSRGGSCARAPSSCLVLDLAREAGAPLDALWFDATYGEGRFYLAFRPALLVGADVRVLDWAVKPDAFILAPVWSSWRYLARLGLKPRVYVLDPPWQECRRGKGCRGREIGGRYHYRASRAVGSPEIILEQGLKAAANLAAEYIIVHWRARPKPPEGYTLAAEAHFKPFLSKAPPDYTIWFGILQRG